MINNYVGVGRLTADPELKYTPSGVAVCRFRLAINRPFKQITKRHNKTQIQGNMVVIINNRITQELMKIHLLIVHRTIIRIWKMICHSDKLKPKQERKIENGKQILRGTRTVLCTN